MSETMIRAVVLAHATMAQGLVDAVRRITGIPDDAIVPVSNTGLSPAVLSDAVRSNCVDGRVIIFTDLPAGSCGVAARLAARSAGSVAVICGVNLPMLLDFATHRDMALEPLVGRLVEKGRAAINCTLPGHEPHGDPALPGR